jgi:hypothetical protein
MQINVQPLQVNARRINVPPGNPHSPEDVLIVILPNSAGPIRNAVKWYAISLS